MLAMKTFRRLKYYKNQPCCGFFLQGGVKAVAIVDFGLQISMIVIISTGIIVGQPVWKADTPERHFVGIWFVKIARPFYWTFYFFYQLVTIGLSVFLFKAANKRDEQHLKQYLLASIILYVFWLICYISHSIWLHGLHPMVIATLGVASVFKLYLIWVVKSFLNEISYYGGFNAALRELTDAEIEAFEKGHPTNHDSENSGNFQNRPYKKDFEISFERLELDEKTPLGSGAFGIVYKANLLAPGNEGPFQINNYNSGNEIVKCDVTTTVAVKTVSAGSDVTYFKALLSELKILSYIGKHENIVNLVGACTSKIRDRKIYVVVEFCPYGNMMDYLRANRGLFINLVQNGQLQTNYKGGPYTNQIAGAPSTIDLIKWSMQTARGMEYIASKKVIHGDLAARNVLLTFGKNVKIADFGLSRQLYNYTSYVKHNDEPLPWRWMAIEALCDMKFSTQSDVWAYGVTLWEFFTCAGTPYPGYSHSGDFMKQLKNGLRPDQPQYSSLEIYEFMQKCWEVEPNRRPSFQDIAQFMENMFKNYCPRGSEEESS